MRRVGLLVLALSSTLACSPDRAPNRPPIVLISIDTLRSDRLPAYGYAKGSTPAIDALAGDGILFERAFAEVPLTLPSHASLFTGEIPPRHGVRDNVGFPVDPRRAGLLADRLRAAGYATFGAVSAQVLARRTGIATGFESWNEPELAPEGGGAVTAERSGRDAVAAALRWLESRAGDPAKPPFVFVHLYEPHAPYRPPAPFAGRFAHPYDGEIAAADALVAELLQGLRARGLYESALVVLLSDHGEGLGEHGEDEHGILLYREALQVPLILKLPGGERAGERVGRNVALIDFVPTILEILGLQPEPALPGLSLLAKAAPADRPIYSETMYPLVHFGWSDLASAISGDHHLISGRRAELFDLAQDPAETRDAFAEQRRAAASLRKFLDGIDRTLAPPEAADAETVRALGALGYLGQSSLPSDRSDLPDPRDRVRELGPVLRGMRHFHEGELEAAVAVLSEATRKGPVPAAAWQFLGSAYDALGRKEEAAAAYRRGMKLTGSPSYLAETAALRLLELGRAEAALELVRGELGRHPESARLRLLLSRALLQTGRVDDAARAADEAVAIDARLADAYYQRAVVAMARRDGPSAMAAIVDLERAAELDPRHLEARKALAMLRYAQGDAAEARRLLQEVLTLDPTDRDAREDLALLERGGTG